MGGWVLRRRLTGISGMQSNKSTGWVGVEVLRWRLLGRFGVEAAVGRKGEAGGQRALSTDHAHSSKAMALSARVPLPACRAQVHHAFYCLFTQPNLLSFPCLQGSAGRVGHHGSLGNMSGHLFTCPTQRACPAVLPCRERQGVWDTCRQRNMSDQSTCLALPAGSGRVKDTAGLEGTMSSIFSLFYDQICSSDVLPPPCLQGAAGRVGHRWSGGRGAAPGVGGS